MSVVQTSPVFIPPPPKPPVRVATGAAEPEPERRPEIAGRLVSGRRIGMEMVSTGFYADVCHDLRRMVWEAQPLVAAQGLVTIMLLAGTACYLNGLSVLMQWVLRTCGIAPQ